MNARDGFARGHFAARVIAVGLFVAPLLLWWSAKDPGTLQAQRQVTGTVVAQNDKIARVALADGREVQVFVGRRKFAAGDEIPLRAEFYSDGSERYWPVRAEGP
jgi:hypothetical protein